MPAELHLLRPLWLLALLPLLGLWLLLWRRRAQDQVWRPLVDPHLLPHLLVGSEGAPRRLPLALLALGWVMGVLALAGPAWERLPVPVFTVDAKRVILLDLSPSMNAVDLSPSRLARARFEVLDLLDASREGQVALLAYGPEPFVVSPLTGDAQTIANQVPQLGSDLIPVPGPRRTDRALKAAADLLAQAGAGPGEVILISDGVGGSDGDGPADQAAAIDGVQALAGAGHRVSVLGVGTADGAPIPGGVGGFASDEDGAIRLSRLDRPGLEALARAGGGRYVELDAGDRDTRTLVGDAPPRQSSMVAQGGLTADQWREEGPWVLLLLLPLAALAFRRGWLLPVVLLAGMLPPHPGWALDWGSLWQRADQRAARALARGDLGRATGDFQDPAWRAAARYRSGDYGRALEDLQGLAGPEPDYNRGNALARLGRLDDAIAAYERALEQDPNLEDAQANLELLRRLKEQQEQHEQEQEQQAPQAGDGGQPERGSQGGEPQQSQGDRGQGSDQAGGQADESPSRGGQGPEDSSQTTGEGRPGGDEAGEEGSGQGSGPGEESPQAGSDSAAAGRAPGTEPSAADLSPEVAGGEPRPEPGPDGQGQGENGPGQAAVAERPEGEAQGTAPGTADPSAEDRERRQAMEAQLRRVPDDPAGLLRQRFILQHLRREGRLP